MIRSAQVWALLEERLTSDASLSLREIYDLVETSLPLDDGDRAGVTAASRSPRWKRTVRNAIQRRKSSGDLVVDAENRFRRGPVRG